MAAVVLLRRLHSIAMVTRKLPHSLLVCVIARAETDLGWRSVHLKVRHCRHCSSCCGHVSFHCTSATTATLGDLSLGRSISRGLLLNPRGDKIGFWGLFVCLCLFVLATVAASVLADPIEIDPMRVRAPHLHTTYAFSRETAALEPQPLLFLDLISSGGDCWFRFRPESAALTW